MELHKNKLVITSCKHLRNENEDDENEEGRSKYNLSAENKTFVKLVCILGRIFILTLIKRRKEEVSY